MATLGERSKIEWILKERFPLLKLEPFEVTSPEDYRYNCIAWAAGENSRVWWPFGSYWPAQVARSTTVNAFIAAYRTHGYTPCNSRDVEVGVEKVAIYVGPDYQVLHAARQLSDGRWTSKLGLYVDVAHTLTGLEGNEYGRVAQILMREKND